MDINSESIGEAWEKVSASLLNFGKKTIIQNQAVIEVRWLGIHVKNPLQKPRISKKFIRFCNEINLEEEYKPDAYISQITGKVKEGYWWNVYGKPIWKQIPKLESILQQNPTYNKPSIVIRNPVKHLGAKISPCLVYLTFLIRNGSLELGVHFDSNAIEYLQGNMIGLSEVQRIMAEKFGLKVGTYNHYCDSLFVNENHLQYLAS